MDFQELLLEHVRRYPLIQTQDVYKLLHQSTHGIGHILNEHARARLTQELNEQKILVGEQLLESVDCENNLVRVNLRPFKSKFIMQDSFQDSYIDKLWKVLLNSQISADKVRLETLCEKFVSLCGERAFRDQFAFGSFDYSSSRATLEKFAQNQFPPVHHSEIYRQHYFPSYRVVKHELFVKEFGLK